MSRSGAIVRAFLFDLDGTLVDSERLWVAAAEQVLRQKGRPIPHEQALARIYGRGWGDIREEMLHDYPDAFADAAELSAAHPVGIVSGSSLGIIHEMVRRLGIERCVSVVVGTEDTPRGKPDPAPYLLGAERLGVSASACVVFEDSRAGVLSAKAAGMYVIALQRDGAPPQDLSEADEVCSDLAELDLGDLLDA